ncbi:hypothetical protein DBR42_03005 [Pelomonas sp. HMWF004]|nr:hypothetical protein DBR42_03005 [Pelomonas sp. HMWF004]
MIWLGPEGGVRLMALGITRIPDPTDPFDRGLSLGAAPAFTAPECRNGSPPSLASEVYGLGALARTLVCGWEDTPRGLAPRRGSVGDLWPQLGEAEQRQLDGVLRSAMAELPVHRTRGAEELADELRAWLGLLRSTGTRPADGMQATRQRAGRRRWLWLAVVAVLALGAAATANLTELRAALATGAIHRPG